MPRRSVRIQEHESKKHDENLNENSSMKENETAKRSPPKKQTRKIVSSSESEDEVEENVSEYEISEAEDDKKDVKQTGKGKRSVTPNKSSPKMNKSHKLEPGIITPVEPELSEYEKQILKNIEDRKKMFEMLNIDEAKAGLTEVLPLSASTTPKPSKRGYKRKEVPSPVEPVRRSLRARKQPPEFQMSELQSTVSGLNSYDKPEIQRPDGPFSMESAYANQEELEDSIRFVKETIPLLESKEGISQLPAETQKFLEVMQNMQLEENGVAKVTKARIYSLAWHPTEAKLLLAAGDRDGNIGFWDVNDTEDKHNGVRVYGVHESPVNCISFDAFNSVRLLSTSYDGKVRRLDFNTQIFDQIYSLPNPNRIWTAYHAQRDESTLIVAQSDGQIAVLDTRTSPANAEHLIHCFDVSVRTVSLDPQNTNLVMACSRKGFLGMFDLRKPPKKSHFAESVVSFPKCERGARSAFFSPVTGQYVLNTATEDVLRIFDVSGRSGDANVVASIRHNNFTGRWLTPFKAAWHPEREDVFVVGSMEKPRRIQLYGAPGGKLLHNLKSDDYLSSVCSINAFHPTLPALAGGNSSGRIHVFHSS